ncbi:UNVERIFIED_CONTAM: hypothetical protein Scaly_2846500 [Sesamum calycinum]|uniref:Uncharacterized protein n=1 Tax=Sesamum calycinum TaxID=2727403 RepID=A0AAW2IR53_9LAMI
MAAGHPLEAPNCVSTQQIVYLKVVNRLLLVVSPTHIELWSSSQHRVRLGKYKRDVDSIRKEGENLRAVWSPDTKLIAVLVSIESLDKMEAFRSNFICDNKHLLIGLSDGSLYNISWKGEFSGAFFLDVWPNDKIGANKLSPHLGNGLTFSGTQGVDGTNHVNHVASRSSGVVHLEFSIMLRLLFVLFSDGELIQCSVSKKGLRHADSITVERRVASGDVVCASVAPEQQILAVGTRKGTVELYDLADSASLIRSCFA